MSQHNQWLTDHLQMKKLYLYFLVLLLGILFSSLTVKADSYTDKNGYTWMYTVDENSMAENVYLRLAKSINANSTVTVPSSFSDSSGEHRIISLGSENSSGDAFFQGLKSFYNVSGLIIDASSCKYLRTINPKVCNNYTDNFITFLLPPSVQTIGDQAFCDSPKLTVKCLNPNIVFSGTDNFSSTAYFYAPAKSTAKERFENSCIEITGAGSTVGTKTNRIDFDLNDIDISGVTKTDPASFTATTNLFKSTEDSNYHTYIFTYYNTSAEDLSDYTALSKISIPSRKHYTFEGFYTDDEKRLLVYDKDGNLAPTAANSIGTSSSTITLKAKWTPQAYSITFMGTNNVTGAPANMTKNYGDTLYLTGYTPVKKGYYFKGFSTSAALQSNISSITITGPTVIWLNFTENQYTMRYFSNIPGDTLPVTGETFSYTSDLTLFKTPAVYNGYDFSGWHLLNDDNLYHLSDVISPKEDKIYNKAQSLGNGKYNIDLYAKWTTHPYKITFQKNDSSEFPASGITDRKYTIETDTFTITDPIRTGYEFTGWTGSNGSAPQMSIKIKKGSYGDLSYQANWTPVSYKISYNANGGSLSSNSTAYTVENDSFTLKAPTRTGYTFVGWTGSNGSTPQKTVTIAKGTVGEKSYMANWSRDEYELSYDLNGGSADNKSSYNIKTEDFTLTNPTKTGYIFAGWSGTGLSDKTMTVTISKGSVGNRSYKANWTAVSYKISYDLDGGSASNSTAYTIETDPIELKAPVKNGYEFAGWSGSNLSGIQKSVTITKGSYGALSYKANWTPIRYTITYDLNGGTGIDRKTYTIESDDFVLEIPTYTGYDFAGWTGSNGSTPQKTITITKGSTGNLTYKANWTPTSYEITYDLTGGTGYNPQSYTMFTDTFILKAPTRTGYIFAGWTGSNGNSPEKDLTIMTGAEGADKILNYYRVLKGAFLCIQKNKRILHYGYIIKQSL